VNAIRPIFIRLPKPGENCPYTGYSRTGLYNLTVPCKANGYKPEVPAKCDKKRGNTRGIWLINFDSLIAFIEGLPTPGMKIDAPAPLAPTAETSRASAASLIQPLAVKRRDAMRMLGTETLSAFHRECNFLGLVAYRTGRYRIRDIENALARAARRAQEAPKQTTKGES
jgi:hypothetical protein